MPFRRRASLLSASDVPRRVCHEVATNSAHVVEHRILRNLTSPPRSLAVASRAMHTTPPRPSLSPSPSATCRWQRGRPVTTKTSIAKQVHQMSIPASQPTSTNTIPWSEGQGQLRRVSVSRAGLWDPSQVLRFASLASEEVQHSLATSADSQTAAEHGCVHEQETVTQDTGNGTANEHKALAYQIPEEKLRAAMLASPKTRASYWSAKLYEGPGGKSLNTHYCRSLEVAERVAQYFLKEKVVGFDIEWKPWGSPTSIKQNASLIQLACEDRIALFHIALFPGTKVEQLMPPSLKAVLESPDICKVGVAIKGDFKRLEKFLDIQAQGVFELSRLHNLVEWYEIDPSKVTKKLVGLAAQVLQHLQLPLYKGEPLEDASETKTSVRESDWSLPLNVQQIHYAAADAYAGFRLYHMLEWKRTQLRPTPPPIPLCDYDNKPLHKTGKPRKRAKAATKSKDAGKTDLDLDPTVDPVGEEQEAEQEADGYETAPEELIDSHQLEDPTSAASPNASRDMADVAVETHSATNAEPQNQRPLECEAAVDPAHKRVGQVNISWLKGADPGYPTLPKGSQQEVEGPSSTEQLNSSSDMPTERNDDRLPPQAQLLQAFGDSDDEFAMDLELEEALRRLDLDETVSVNEETNEFALEPISPLASTGYNKLEMLESQDVPSADVAVPNDATVIDPSDPDPTSLATDEVDEPTARTSEPSVDLSEEPLHTPEYTSATNWAQEYLQSTIPSPTSTVPSRIRATVPHLRAYHLWFHQKRSIDEIARLLRDPSISHSTTINYILQAISLERLEYEKDPLRSVMMAMPPGMRKGRWRGLAEKVGASD